MLVHWIWLAHRPNLSERRKWEILQQFGDPEQAYFANSYEQLEELSREGYASLMDKDLAASEKILIKCEENGLQVLTAGDAAYPARLKNIYDPPLVLYYRGRLPDFDGSAAIGVVGTRKATPYGLDIARRMGWELAASGGLVVSGMALGIDAMAMQGALMAGSPTVGVLGCGADRVYPAKNKELFEDVSRYGCILSEFPPEDSPAAWHFPRRNRIISGLCSGILVVEAPKKSGALITARQALDQGRDVFVVPGNVGNPACEGSNLLLREGAQAVGCGWDILEEYASRYPGKLRKIPGAESAPHRQVLSVAEPRKDPTAEEKKPEKKPRKTPASRPRTGQEKDSREKLGIDNPTAQTYIDINDILQRCNSQEKTIVLTLQKGEMPVDNLIAETGLKAQSVLAGLTMLEIKGIVSRLPGRRICLRKK